ncbi:MAG: hypothetical protein ACE5FL_04475 [Myxococcota bacterium]
MESGFACPWLAAGAIASALMLAACGEPSAPAATATSAPGSVGGVADNRPPRVEGVRLEPAEPLAGDAVRAVVRASDPDGDPVVLVYEWRLNDRPVGRGTQRLMLSDAAKGDSLEVAVIASDGRAESEPRRSSVRIGNRPPRVERLRIEPSPPFTAGMTLRVRAEAEDADGDDVEFSYRWTLNGVESGSDDPEFDTSALDRGDVLTVSVRAGDGNASGEALASPPLEIVNRAPRVTSRPGPSALGGGFFYRVTAEDPDGDEPLRFELDGAPAGMVIGPISGEITWRPAPSQAGRHTVRVIIDDLKGGRVAHAFEVDVAGTTPPAAPGL